MKTTLSTGASRGTVTRRNTCHSVPPSVRPASSTSRGMAARPAAMTTIAKPAHTQMYATINAGVINFGPSQATPPKGFAKVFGPIATLYSPPCTPTNENVPLSSVLTDSTFLPVAFSNWTVTPGRPNSPCSTWPAFPPPGLKSRQTTPAMPFATGLGLAACTAVLGTSLVAMPVRPSRPTPPG